MQALSAREAQADSVNVKVLAAMELSRMTPP
jgi:hypothetical protein